MSDIAETVSALPREPSSSIAAQRTAASARSHAMAFFFVIFAVNINILHPDKYKLIITLYLKDAKNMLSSVNYKLVKGICTNYGPYET